METKKDSKNVRVINEFGGDITTIVRIKNGRVYNEFGGDITNIVRIVIK